LAVDRFATVLRDDEPEPQIPLLAPSLIRVGDLNLRGERAL
jgi:hypothetical protein